MDNMPSKYSRPSDDSQMNIMSADKNWTPQVIIQNQPTAFALTARSLFLGIYPPDQSHF
jgi:hypothetical protein